MSGKKKVLIILIIVLMSIFIVAYFSGAFYYKGKFPSNTYVNEVNVGGMTLKESNNKLAKTDSWDKVIVKGDTEEFLEIKLEEIDYKYIDSPGLSEILNQQNKWQWFLNIFKSSSYTTVMTSEYNKDKIKEMINGMENIDTEPLNAKVVYSDSSNAFVIKPESKAINLTREQLFDLVAKDIDIRNGEVNVEENIVEPTLFADDESLAEARDKANQYLSVKLQYDFEDRQESIDSSLLKDWIIFNEKEVDIDSEKVKEYVAELARKYDTYGRNREFRTNTGENITISGGTYGWVTHRGKTADELIKHIKSGENKTIQPVYSYKSLIRSSNDIGNSYVEIDLKGQTVSVYIGGELRVKTPAVTGDASKGYDTPPGVYPLNYKERDAVLRGESYASPVKYWMPFNGNIGLHDADWRTSFGGDIYKSSGSHGCINLPPDNAKTIFDLVYPGMPVIVY